MVFGRNFLLTQGCTADYAIPCVIINYDLFYGSHFSHLFMEDHYIYFIWFLCGFILVTHGFDADIKSAPAPASAPMLLSTQIKLKRIFYLIVQ